MSTSSGHATAPQGDVELVRALRAGDEAAFVELIRAHHSVLLRVALTYVSSRADAEEVVQETWLAVLKGLQRFEGRSSLRSWIFRNASDIARTRAARDSRSRPCSTLDSSDVEPAVDPRRFVPADHAAYAGHWARRPVAWDTPEDRLRSRETQAVIRTALEHLPPAQRLVVTLRDVEGWSADETSEALELTAADQRVLLNRARSHVRAALERHLGPAETPA
jgi:RNA polymerase sigma-70 factor (ECF subfamily)